MRGWICAVFLVVGAPLLGVVELYVSNRSDTTVSVIDTATDNIIATVTVGSFPFTSGTSPDGNTVWVPIFNTANVMRIDTASNLITATISSPTSPTAVLATPDGNRVYGFTNVADLDPTTFVINTSTNGIIATFGFSGGRVITPDSSRVYVVDGSTVNVISNSLVPALLVSLAGGSSPTSPVVTPDGSKVYVPNAGGTNVSVIDNTQTPPVITATVPVGSGPVLAVVTPDGSKVYVACSGSSNVFVISTSSNTVIATIPVGTGTAGRGLAVTRDGTRVYEVNNTSNNVSVISTSSNTVIATIPLVVSTNYKIIASPDGTKMYVSNQSTNNISVISTASNSVIRTISGLGAGPSFMTFAPPFSLHPLNFIGITPDGSEALVTNPDSNDVTAINTTSHAIAATIPVGTTPQYLSFSPIIIPPPTPSTITTTVFGRKRKSEALFESFYFNKLTWPAVYGASTYQIYRNGTLVGTTDQLGFVDEGVGKHQVYTYTVLGFDSSGTEISSGTVTIP